MRAEGKIRHIGLCAVEVDQIEQARKLVEVASVQNIYNLTRQRHRDVMEYCTRGEHPVHAVLPATGRSAG